jgi:hypothetical protein
LLVARLSQISKTVWTTGHLMAPWAYP